MNLYRNFALLCVSLLYYSIFRGNERWAVDAGCCGCSCLGKKSKTAGKDDTVQSDGKNGIELDIKKKDSNSAYGVQEGTIDVLYYPKGQNKFKSVKDGSTIIWKGDKENEYAIRVKVDYEGVLVSFEKTANKKFIKTRTGCCPSCKWLWYICTFGIYYCATKEQWIEEKTEPIPRSDNKSKDATGGTGTGTTTGSGGGGNQTGTTGAGGTGKTGTGGSGGGSTPSGGQGGGTPKESSDQSDGGTTGTKGGGTQGTTTPDPNSTPATK